MTMIGRWFRHLDGRYVTAGVPRRIGEQRLQSRHARLAMIRDGKEPSAGREQRHREPRELAIVALDGERPPSARAEARWIEHHDAEAVTAPRGAPEESERVVADETVPRRRHAVAREVLAPALEGTIRQIDADRLGCAAERSGHRERARVSEEVEQTYSLRAAAEGTSVVSLVREEPCREPVVERHREVHSVLVDDHLIGGAFAPDG